MLKGFLHLGMGLILNSSLWPRKSHILFLFLKSKFLLKENCLSLNILSKKFFLALPVLMKKLPI
jgi:hypothetical protein